MTAPFFVARDVITISIHAARTRSHLMLRARREGDEAETTRHREFRDYYLRMARDAAERIKPTEEDDRDGFTD